MKRSRLIPHGSGVRNVAGAPQESYDKQIIRNYLIELKWDRRPPAPHLPPEIIAQAAARYQEIAAHLTGEVK
jgi:phosphoribosylaminoimidazole-succinocarboxamide synthase